MGFSTIGGAATGGSAETPSGDGTSQVAFKTVAVSGQSDVVADGVEDTLTLAAGSNVTITTNAGTDTVTIASTGGGAALDGIDDQSSSLDDCITILDAEVVINEDGDDQDFRVESDTLTHALFVQASDGKVGINDATPASLLSLGGADPVIGTDSDDGSDDRTLYLSSAGGTASNDRGAYITLNGNEHATNSTKGCITLVMGDGSGGHGGDLKIYTGTNERIKVADTGQVGIGTFSVTHFLELKTDTTSANTTIAAAMTDGLCLNMGASVANGEFAPAISWYSDDGSLASDGTEDHIAAITAQAAEDFDGTDSDNSGTDLVFFTHPDSTGGGVTEKLRITAGGRGISQFTAGGWITFDGTGTVGISDSHNVSSLADNGTGSYTISWDVDFADANYCCAGMCEDLSYGGTLSVWDDNSKAADTLKIATHSKDTQTDADIAMVVAFGDF